MSKWDIDLFGIGSEEEDDLTKEPENNQEEKTQLDQPSQGRYDIDLFANDTDGGAEEVAPVSSTEEEEKTGWFDKAVSWAAERTKRIGKGVAGGAASALSSVGTFFETTAQIPGSYYGQREFVKAVGKSIREFYSKKAQDFSVKEYDINPLDDPGIMLDPAFTMYHFSRQAPMIIAGVTGGPWAAGLVGGGMMADDTYNEMKAKGASDSTASKAAAVDFVIGSALEKFGFTVVFRKGGTVIGRVLRGGAAEGTTEFSQELVSAMNKRVSKGFEDGDSSYEIVDDLIDHFGPDIYQSAGAGIIGALVGGPLSGIAGVEGESKKVDPRETEANILLQAKKANEQEAVRRMLQVQAVEEGVTPQKAGDAKARELKKPIISLEPEGVFRNKYDENGEFIGREQMQRHISMQPPAVKNNIHITRKTSGQQNFPKKIPFKIEPAVKEAASLVERGVNPATVVEQMLDTRLSGKSADESAKVFVQQGKSRVEEILDTFHNEKELHDAMLISLRDGSAKPGEVAQALINDLTSKYAGDSAQVFDEDMENFLMKLDDAAANAQKGRHTAAIRDIQRAVSRKGKSAEKSAKVFEDKGKDSETARVEKAKEDFQNAMERNDEEGMNNASLELYEALRARDIKEGRNPETSMLPSQEPVAEDLEQQDQSPVYTQEEVPEATVFDPNTGTPIVAVRDVAIEETPEETLRPVDEEVSQRLSGDYIHPGVKGVVSQPEGQRLVQALLDGDPRYVEDALNNFPVSQRAAAYKRASQDAVKVAVETGIVPIKEVRYNISENEEYVKYQGKKAKGERIKVTNHGAGIWVANDAKSGKKFSIIKKSQHPKSKFILAEGSQEISEVKSVAEAVKKIKEFSQPEVRFVSIKKPEAGPRNQWQVLDNETGKIVPATKVKGGEGYTTEKSANAEADRLNNIEPSEDTQPYKKVEYTETAREYASGEDLVEKKPQTPVKKAARMAVAVRKKVSNAVGREEANVAGEGNRDSSWRSSVKYLNDFQGDIEGEISVTDTMLDRDFKRKGATGFVRSSNNQAIQKSLDVLEGIFGKGFLDDLNINVHNNLASVKSLSESSFDLFSEEINLFTRRDMGGQAFWRTRDAVSASMLHEAIHAKTAKVIEMNLKTTGEIEEVQKLASLVSDQVLLEGERKIVDLFRGSPKDFTQWIKSIQTEGFDVSDVGSEVITRQRLLYGLLTPHEFLANSVHPQIKSILQNVKLKNNQTVFQRVKSIVKKVLGLSEPEYTAFDKAMELLDRIARENDSVAKAKVSERLFNSLETTGRTDRDIQWVQEYIKQAEGGVKGVKTPGPQKGKKKDGLLLRNLKDAGEGFRDVAIGINDRLETINPALSFKVRSEEGFMLERNKKHQQSLAIFKRNFDRIVNQKGMSDEDVKSFHLSLFNQDEEGIKKVVESDKKIKRAWDGLQKNVKAVEKMLVETGALRQEDLIEGYVWHRELDDVDGLVKAMNDEKKKAPEGNRNTVIQNEINTAADMNQRLGMDRPTAMARAASDLMTTGRRPATLRIIKGAKERRFPKVPSKYFEFYKDPFESMANHFEEANEQIAMRKIIGSNNLKDLYRRSASALKKSEKATDPDLKKMYNDEYVRLEHSIDEQRGSLEKSVAGYVTELEERGEIRPDQIETVTKLIRGRVTQHGIANAAVKGIRDVGLAISLGHYSNTLTQAKDGSLVVYRHGLGRSAVSLFKTLARKNRISAYEFDLQRVFNEFRTSTNSWNLTKLFRVTGFLQLDNLMKTVNLQAHVDTLLKQAKTEKGRAKIHAKYDLAMGRDAVGKIIQDLQNDKITSDIKNLAIVELSKDVPIFLSEMPYAYNQAGNMRIAYTLKSYAVKIFNIAYRDGIRKMAKGATVAERLQGAKNLAALCVILALYGGAVEEVKDALIGRETPFWTNATDEILNIVMLSQYSLDRASQTGPSEFFKNMVSVPALSLIDMLWKGVKGDISGFKYIPVPGAKEMYYNMTFNGRMKNLNMYRRSVFGRLKSEMESTGKVSQRLKEDIRNYNAEARAIIREYGREQPKDKLPKLIKSSTIRSVRDKIRRQRMKDNAADRSLGIAGSIADVVGPTVANASQVPRLDVPYVREDGSDDSVGLREAYFHNLLAQENSKLLSKKYWDGAMIYPNRAPEDSGGMDIGFGHKITMSEARSGKIYGISFKEGITLEQAMEIARRDLAKHESKAKRKAREMGFPEWDNLDIRIRQILTDFSYTGTLNKFPRFFNALKDKDFSRALVAHKRKWKANGRLIPLDRRNEMIKEILYELKDDGVLV